MLHLDGWGNREDLKGDKREYHITIRIYSMEELFSMKRKKEEMNLNGLVQPKNRGHAHVFERITPSFLKSTVKSY